MSTYDLVVIGAGHNGLAAAALLGKQGKKVLVIERGKQVGGLASGYEFHPGFRSASLLQDASTVRGHILDQLRLSQHGLQIKNGRHNLLIMHADGALVLNGNAQQSAAEIAKISSADAENYIKFRDFIGRIENFLYRVVSDTVPDVIHPTVGDFYQLMKKAVSLRWLGKQDMMEVLRIAPMCVADYLNEWFSDQRLKSALCVPGVRGDFVGPWSPATNTPYLIWEASSRFDVQGGPAALVKALQSSALSQGVEIRCQSEVEEIIVENQQVRGLRLKGNEMISTSQVLATCDAKTLFLNLIRPSAVPHQLAKRMMNWRMRGSTAQLNLALKKPITLPHQLSDQTHYALIAGDHLDHVEKQFDPMKYGEFSAEPVVEIHLPSRSHSDLCPAGHEVMSVLVHFAPYHLKTPWDAAAKKKLTDNTLQVLCRHISGLKESILASDLLSPVDIERQYGVNGGHIYHGEHGLDQLLMRPSPETMRYRSPIAGLTLGGSSSFPGGGITCAPGALAASILLKS